MTFDTVLRILFCLNFGYFVKITRRPYLLNYFLEELSLYFISILKENWTVLIFYMPKNTIPWNCGCFILKLVVLFHIELPEKKMNLFDAVSIIPYSAQNLWENRESVIKYGTCRETLSQLMMELLFLLVADALSNIFR